MHNPIKTIYKKRLDRIRDSLDEFLAKEYRSFDVNENLTSNSESKNAKEYFILGRLHNPLDKVLNIMKLSDDYDNSGYDEDNEDEKGLEYPEPSHTNQKVDYLESSCKESNIICPDSLRNNPCMNIKENLDQVLQQKAETFSEMLLRIIDEKGLKDSEVYKRANIDRRLFSKIRGDEDYVPSKKTAISFCLALRLNLDETKNLLSKAGYALSEASRFDLIITYLIENGEYNVHFANIVLDDYGLGSLSK